MQGPQPRPGAVSGRRGNHPFARQDGISRPSLRLCQPVFDKPGVPVEGAVAHGRCDDDFWSKAMRGLMFMYVTLFVAAVAIVLGYN